MSSLYAKQDDRNPTQEDKLLDSNNPLTEIIWQKDKEYNKEANPIDINEDLTIKGTGIHHNLDQTLVTITFHKQQVTWCYYIIFYYCKCYKVEYYPFLI